MRRKGRREVDVGRVERTLDGRFVRATKLRGTETTTWIWTCRTCGHRWQTHEGLDYGRAAELGFVHERTGPCVVCTARERDRREAAIARDPVAT